MKRRLPPLLALRAFEAAGRHLSFSKASEELNVTQGAVSRQVKILEAFLQTPLFIREPRGVSLTDSGRRYLAMASSAFDRIDATLLSDDLPRQTLSISVLPSLATLWLQQRLSDFGRLNPDIRLYISSSQNPVDFQRDQVDVALRVGRLPGQEASHHENGFSGLEMVSAWSGVQAIHLWDEHVSPICSQYFLENGSRLESVEDLSAVTLIHNVSRPECWSIWLRANHYPAVKGRNTVSVGQRFMAVLAAREGRGVACVPTMDIDMLEWRDELIRPFDSQIATGGAYYLLHRKDSERSEAINAFRNWLVGMHD